MTEPTGDQQEDGCDMDIDQQKLQAFMGTFLGDLGGATSVLMVCLGEELGLYEAMDGAGPVSPASLAGSTGYNERLVQEWLDQQAAAGYVLYDATAGTYALPPEQAMALAPRQSPAFMAAGMAVTVSMFEDLDKVAEAFRGDGALAWGEHSDSLHRGVAEFFRPGYQHHLTNDWIPSLSGVTEVLASGGRIADVGCGHGISAIVMAQAYDQTEIHGFDCHPASIDAARDGADTAGVMATVFDEAGYSHFRRAAETPFNIVYEARA